MAFANRLGGYVQTSQNPLGLNANQLRGVLDSIAVMRPPANIATTHDTCQQQIRWLHNMILHHFDANRQAAAAVNVGGPAAINNVAQPQVPGIPQIPNMWRDYFDKLSDPEKRQFASMFPSVARTPAEYKLLQDALKNDRGVLRLSERRQPTPIARRRATFSSAWLHLKKKPRF